MLRRLWRGGEGVAEVVFSSAAVVNGIAQSQSMQSMKVSHSFSHTSMEMN